MEATAASAADAGCWHGYRLGGGRSRRRWVMLPMRVVVSEDVVVDLETSRPLPARRKQSRRPPAACAQRQTDRTTTTRLRPMSHLRLSRDFVARLHRAIESQRVTVQLHAATLPRKQTKRT